MKIIFAFLLLALAGCTTFQPLQIPAEHPELVSMAPLPPLRPIHAFGGLRLTMMMHIVQDGTVDEAEMVGSSGDAEWDSLAVKSVKEWRFVPPLRDGAPVDTWIRQVLIVQIQDPVIIPLEELALASRRKADSLYALLEQGADFDSLVRTASAASAVTSDKILGEVNLAVFAPHVREELKKLRENDISPPLRVGGTYYIYKRIPKDMAPRVPHES